MEDAGWYGSLSCLISRGEGSMMSRLSKGALLGVAAGIVGIVASSTLVGLNLEEYLGLEILFHLRGERTPPSDGVVVSVSKESADSLDLPDDLKHWPRSLHARLTETLAKGGAAVIAFDVFFEDPSEEGDDLMFAETIRKGKKRSVGDSARPTLPVVAFHLFALPAYDDFLRLLEEVFPEQAKRLPRSGEEMVRSRGVGGTIRHVREIFENEPLAEKKMLDALDSPTPRPAEAKSRRILRSFIHLYGGGVSKFLNFYGPTRQIR